MTRPLLEMAIARTDEKWSNHTLWNKFATSWQSELFLTLVKEATVSVVYDHESSSGDAVPRLLTPEEVIERAIRIMDLALPELERRGYVVETPKIDELKEVQQERVGF